MRTLLAATFLSATVLLSACGGGGGDRPSSAEISTALQAEDNLLGTPVPAEAADCLGDVLVESELSDEALTALVEGDEDYDGEGNEEDVLNELSTEAAKCVQGS